jgi:hypothetical protein
MHANCNVHHSVDTHTEAACCAMLMLSTHTQVLMLFEQSQMQLADSESRALERTVWSDAQNDSDDRQLVLLNS